MLKQWLGLGVDAVVSRMVYAFAGSPSPGSHPAEVLPDVPADIPARWEEPPAGLEQPGVKLVRYTLVSLRPCAERILPEGTGEVVVTGRVSSEDFAVGTISFYLESHEIPHEDKRYLRVVHRLLDRWPRQPLRCREEKELAALEAIRLALLGCGGAFLTVGGP
jgi:hypothetical protein